MTAAAPKMKRGGGQTVNNRISTIVNAFSNSLYDPWSSGLYCAEIEEKKKRLLNYDGLTCVYCRVRPAKTEDHFVPLIRDKKPTTFVSCSSNMIPCCKECNSSKGGKLFEEWSVGKHLLETDERWKTFTEWHKDSANMFEFSDGDEELYLSLQAEMHSTMSRWHCAIQEISMRGKWKHRVVLDYPDNKYKDSKYWKYSVTDLKYMLKALRVTGISRFTKSELVECLVNIIDSIDV
jgi:hypothetical protein